MCAGIENIKMILTAHTQRRQLRFSKRRNEEGRLSRMTGYSGTVVVVSLAIPAWARCSQLSDCWKVTRVIIDIWRISMSRPEHGGGRAHHQQMTLGGH